MKKYLTAVALLLAAGITCADESSPSLLKSSEDLARSYVLGRTINMGPGFSQGTFKFSRRGDNAQLTDNGGPTLMASVDSRLHPLTQWDMRHGLATLGYDFTATASGFSPSRQLIGSATQGVDIGTRVNGGYLAAAGRLGFAMGPLYADRPVFWKYTVGLGAAMMQYSGHAAFYGDQSSGVHSVSGSAIPSLYIETAWQMVMGHWDLLFKSQYLGARHSGYLTTYEVYGAGLVYQFSF